MLLIHFLKKYEIFFMLSKHQIQKTFKNHFDLKRKFLAIEEIQNESQQQNQHFHSPLYFYISY